MTTTLYELWHFEIGPDDEFDDEKHMTSIGIYSSEANAKAAIEQLKTQLGFRDWPGGFRIFTRTLDETTWKEGYVNPYEDEDWPRPAG